MEETFVLKKGRRLFRRVVPIGGCAILVVIVLYSAVLCMRLQTRYTVIGTTDPETGMRMEYTVSSRYLQKRDETDKSTPHVHDAFTDWQFTPSSPSPWIRWLCKNVLKSSEAALSDLDGSSDITQTNSKHSNMAGWYVDAQGYVRVDLKRSPELVMAAVVSQEYKMVGDCPTTLVVEDSDLMVNGHMMQYYDLLVRPRGQTIIYVFETTGYAGTSHDPGMSELKAIRDSVRSVKAR